MDFNYLFFRFLLYYFLILTIKKIQARIIFLNTKLRMILFYQLKK